MSGLAVVAVFVPPPSGFPEGALAAARARVAAALGARDDGGYALIAPFDAREAALDAAFAAARAAGPGIGRATLVCASGDVDRAWRLAIGLDRDVVPHAVEVLASPGFADGFALPAGVGAFKAPGHGHGNDAHVLVDYR